MIALSTSTEDLLQRTLAKGRFTSADEVIQTAVAVMHEADREREEARAAVAEAIAQIERGEGIPLAQFLDEVRATSARLLEKAK